MKNIIFFLSMSLVSLNFLFSQETLKIKATTEMQPTHELTIVGAGIAGAIESYCAYKDALEKNEKICITVYDKGASFSKPALSSTNKLSTNTIYNIFPSLTIDEILSVVPRGPELVEKLAILFSDPGGIRVDDVPNVNDSPAAIKFKKAVELYGSDENHEDRTEVLLKLGKMSMDLWQNLYDQGDQEFKAIMEDSNFNPCREPKNKGKLALHDGYRIDLMYEIPDAEKRAQGMKATYEQFGYASCKVLSPSEVIAIDPSLTDFCNAHSVLDAQQTLQWKNDSCAVWRPGGCIDTRVLLPKLYAYLKRMMGTYVTSSGEIKDCFNLEFNKEVVAVEFNRDPWLRIRGLKFSDGSVKRDNYPYVDTRYVFCPGEAVGTLEKLGFEEPAYAGFAGPSLFFQIPLSADQVNKYNNFSHCMEVHKVGVVLAWQARRHHDKIFIGVAGTKAFYGDKVPSKDEAFAKYRHLAQLNMVNSVIPEILSIACGYDTKGQTLTAADLKNLEDKGILDSWVGRRAVTYDGFPTLGSLYNKGEKITNGRCTTHLGSGGGSFSPAAVAVSRSSEKRTEDEFIEKVLNYADSRRHPQETKN